MFSQITKPENFNDRYVAVQICCFVVAKAVREKQFETTEQFVSERLKQQPKQTCLYM